MLKRMIGSIASFKEEKNRLTPIRRPIQNFVSTLYAKEYSIKPKIFDAVQFETRTGCNYSCPFCPSNKREREQGVMSMKLFNKIIGELSDMNFSGEIEPFMINEPLLDRRLIRMVKIISDKCENSRILISTNGALMTKDILKKLLVPKVELIVNDYTPNKEVTRKIMKFYKDIFASDYKQRGLTGNAGMFLSYIVNGAMTDRDRNFIIRADHGRRSWTTELEIYTRLWHHRSRISASSRSRKCSSASMEKSYCVALIGSLKK